MMVSVDKVVEAYSLKPNTFKLAKEDTTKMNEIITDFILQCEDLIKTYCNQPFTETPKAIENICMRMVSNMITFTVQRRDTPIIKVNDWTISTVSSDIFTDDLKKDLEPFVIEHSTKSDTVTFTAITGD